VIAVVTARAGAAFGEAMRDYTTFFIVSGFFGRGTPRPLLDQVRHGRHGSTPIAYRAEPIHVVGGSHQDPS
jgi:hypothetical protein